MTSKSQYDVGDLVRIRGEFRVVGSVIDPDNVFVSWRKPDKTIVTKQFGVDVEVTKDGTGIYSAIVDIDSHGRWDYRWFSTGTGQSAAERSFTVKKSNF